MDSAETSHTSSDLPPYQANNVLPVGSGELEPAPSPTTAEDLVETLRRFFPGVEVVEEDSTIVIREG